MTYLFCLRHLVHFLALHHGALALRHVFLCHPSCHGPSHQGSGSGHESVHGRGGHSHGRDDHNRDHGGRSLGRDGHSLAHTCHLYEGSSHHDRDAGMANGHGEEEFDHVDGHGLNQIAKTRMEVFEPTDDG